MPAALGLWSYVRWAGATPDSMMGAVRRVLMLQVGAGALDVGLEAAPSLAILIVIGAVVPELTYAFLASIGFLKVCADQFGGAA